MTDVSEPRAEATALVLAIIAETEGEEVASRATKNRQTFSDHVRRVIARQMELMEKCCLSAVHHVSVVEAASDRTVAIGAYRCVENDALLVGVRAEEVRCMAVLDPEKYASEVAKTERAVERSTDALGDAFSALGLSSAEALDFVLEDAEARQRARALYAMPVTAPVQ